uniref:NADH-ubiquinone oxidoreductase chain 5 n=1 Tax=Sclerolinum brattstromi TaxID=167799 RepID=A0A0E3DQW9_9ANNE|nr:NADH dehydrogenase subunit 5 [Sclerolinum brattstromi]AIL54777.1 NADH dehydrogenase subunit 5 [Sclerolinum brattstromi]
MAPLHASITLLFLSCVTLSSSLFLLSTPTSLLLTWHMMSISSTHISFSLIFDPQGLLFMSVIMFISSNVLMFSKSYMKHEFYISRFTHLTLLFILSMNMLVLFPHLMILLLGWDGLGITSFLLIIYYQNSKSLAAGMFTAIINRIGDVLILVSIAWLLNNGNWVIFNVWMNDMSMLIATALMTAAMTKSAQIPFSSWLPAAMEAPTPVSALVHSSTLVTGGVFLLIRFFPFLNQFQFFNSFLLIMASLTMLMAGLSAMNEMDMKKVIALSTLSQLGLMMMSLALAIPSLTLFHLLTHALFKALLFMAAGNIIFTSSHNQDLRLMGLAGPSIPLSSTSMLIANMALFGAPFLAGFYSKDLILEEILFSQSNALVFMIAFFATGLTSGYSLRMMMMILWSPKHSIPCSNLSDMNFPISASMWMMTLAAIMGGCALNWILQAPMIPFMISFPQKLLTPLVIILGMVISWNMSKPILTSILLNFPKTLHSSSSMWFLVNLTSQLVIKSPFMTSHMLTLTSENGWLEVSSSQGMLNSFTYISSSLQLTQSKMMNKFLLMGAIMIIPLMLTL